MLPHNLLCTRFHWITSVLVLGLGFLAFDFDDCSHDLVFRQICLSLFLLSYLRTSLVTLSHLEK